MVQHEDWENKEVWRNTSSLILQISFETKMSQRGEEKHAGSGSALAKKANEENRLGASRTGNAEPHHTSLQQ